MREEAEGAVRDLRAAVAAAEDAFACRVRRKQLRRACALPQIQTQIQHHQQAPLHSCVTPACFVCGRQCVLGNVAKVLLRGSIRGAYHGVCNCKRTFLHANTDFPTSLIPRLPLPLIFPGLFGPNKLKFSFFARNKSRLSHPATSHSSHVSASHHAACARRLERRCSVERERGSQHAVVAFFLHQARGGGRGGGHAHRPRYRVRSCGLCSRWAAGGAALCQPFGSATRVSLPTLLCLRRSASAQSTRV